MMATGMRRGATLWLVLAASLFSVAWGGETSRQGEPHAAGDASYYRQIRPIFQSHCHGCHQPAKASGEYVMTTYARLLAGGESGTPAVVPGKPDESYLLEMVTPVDGQAEMPQDRPPLGAKQIQRIRRWIATGAADDTPKHARERYDANHPPVYTRSPVVTSIDYSPDGRLLAVAGFHEVLLHRPDGTGLIARLVGMSERIESLAFSPDGKWLAVTGGLPGRMGEVQVWNVEIPEGGLDQLRPELSLSVPVTYDTIRGGSWSPGGKSIAFGCADNTLRVIDAQTGRQVLFQGAHTDWVRDTVFSADGKHLVSVGRDMTAKLTEVATQRFVDNITSITPGVLKGGITAVARHPRRDEIVIGGADGIPKVYRMFRQTVRRIGDDANLIRRMPPMKGRIFSVAVSHDGRRLAAGSSLNGSGEVAVYSYEFDTQLSDQLKKIMSKTISQRSEQERQQLQQYRTRNVRRVSQAEIPAGVFAVAFHPDDRTLAAAGADGVVRLVDVKTGDLRRQFQAVPVTRQSPAQTLVQQESAEPAAIGRLVEDSLPETAELLRLEVEPDSVKLTNRFDYAQLLVTGVMAGGERRDVTRMVRSEGAANVARLSPDGVLQPVADGQASLRLTLAGKTVAVPVAVHGASRPFRPDFVRDVAPIVSRLGCNTGTCHGAAKGKNGFKLSLRGYDPLADVRALTDDLASRRTNVASPDDSLMLLKATAAVPHVGGQRLRPGQDRYQILRDWIAEGARLNRSTPRVDAIHILPTNPIIQRISGQQQVRVVARYADGRLRDVTQEAFITSGNNEVADVGPAGLLTALRRGESPVLARFEGAYAATTLTVMGNRDGFVWKDPPANNRVDELTAAKWKRMKIQPSERCTDTDFLRRVYLDLTGLPPRVENLRRFLADPRDTKTKRDEVIERLVGSDEYVDYWTNKWADLLQVNRKYLGRDGAASYRQWIRTQLADNRPYDVFVREILTARGSNRDHPAASYFKVLRHHTDMMENTTQLFLAVRFNCNKCHDHPFERWTQDQYYQTAAFFARVDLKPDPASGDRRIGGTAVEGAKPLYEIVSDKKEGEVVQARTGSVAAPQFPYACQFQAPDGATRRQRLACWLTSPDNRYFARSYVNRLWGYLLGVGIIEPIDDIRAGNPPSNPELLDYLTREFITSGFNVHHMMRLICRSRTYQLSLATNKWNRNDRVNYSHAVARRLPAEVLYDAIHAATGSVPKLPGVAPGTRAVELPDAGVKLPSGFLVTLGRPPRESACECERGQGLQLGPVMALINGPVMADAIADPNNQLAQLAAREPDDRKLIQAVFLRVLNRPARDEEIEAALESTGAIQADHDKLSAALKQRQAWWATRKPVLEKQRGQAIADAKNKLAAYEQRTAAERARRQSQRADRIQRAEAQLAQYETALDQHAADWLDKHGSRIEWFPLEVVDARATNNAQLTVQADRSIHVEGNAGKGAYTLTARTRLRDITGVRLEALPDPSRKGGGPGLAENGNFVLTELKLAAAPRRESAKPQEVALRNARADFTQQGFLVDQAIDGQTGDQRGWAVHPAGGVVHWATFETGQPVGFEQGTVLRITLYQHHNARDHRLGRFRVSVTTDPGPLGASLPDSLKAIAVTDPARRTPRQREQLAGYFRKTDPQLRAKQSAVATARKPLPLDPELQRLQARLRQASQPVPEDPQLVQLRQDYQRCRKQLENKRLTGVQDLAWALMNSPAFLFNH